MKKKLKIDDLQDDPLNANTGTTRGRELVEASLRTYGAGRSIVIDQQGRVIAGHTTLRGAKAAGITKIQVVPSRGDTLVVVQREDLDLETDVRARELAVVDNRSSELGLEWSADRLKALQAAGGNLGGAGFTADELRKLFKSGAPGLTDPNAVPPQRATSIKAGDLFQLGDHRLLCGDSTIPDLVQRLMGDRRAGLMNTDPPYGIKFDNAALGPTRKKYRDIANDSKTDQDLQQFLESVFRLAKQVALGENAAWYLWHAHLTQGFFAAAAAAAVVLHRQIIWVKPRLILGRGHYHWKHEPCQPPGTMVRIAIGKHGSRDEVPIETLKTGDSVVSFDKYSSQIVGLRGGRTVVAGERFYDGELFEVSSAGKRTRCTDNHLWTTKLGPEASRTWCVYLMRKGAWWRVGFSKLLAPYGCTVKGRAKAEAADALWLLSLHESVAEAICAEQVASVKYGIPTTHWRTSSKARSPRLIASIYERLDLSTMAVRAEQALVDHGRRLEYPFVHPANYINKFSRRASMRVHACNLVPGAMLIPVAPETGDTALWEPVSAISRSPYSGPVYSLDVAQFKHYIADGLITHNCFMGWVEGHQPPDYGLGAGERTQTTVWEIDGVPKSDRDQFNHASPKPVEIFAIPIVKHLRAGEVCYEPFAGSGPQFIAAEQLGVSCYGIEIDASYCQVIIDRWEAFTGRKATRIARLATDAGGPAIAKPGGSRKITGRRRSGARPRGKGSKSSE